jgi:hypothetical protein
MAVFHWIEMDVIHMSGQVSFVSDEVFPLSALPDGAFPFARPPAFPLGDMAREFRFDEHPRSGVVRVSWIGVMLRERTNIPKVNIVQRYMNF